MLQEYTKNIVDIAIHLYLKNLHNFNEQIIKKKNNNIYFILFSNLFLSIKH